LVVFSKSADFSVQESKLPLYEEPCLIRIGALDGSRLSGNEWIFDIQEGPYPLIVFARKGDWLRVVYDDSGRDAWIDPQNRGRFQAWEEFLRLQTGHLLPGLQPQYYLLQQEPGGQNVAKLTSKNVFKVLRVESVWCLVMIGQTQIGWLRWRDEDSRLLVGFDR
jgi:SH3-like domain-containing protein